MPTPQKAAFLRPALAPSLLGAIVLVAGVALLDSTIFIGFRYAIAILAAIVCVFAYRGRGWGYLPFLAAIVVLWNPVYVIPITGQPWQILQFLAAAVFIVVGIRVKVPSPEAPPTSRSTAAARRR
jgi:predicted membrane protein